MDNTNSKTDGILDVNESVTAKESASVTEADPTAHQEAGPAPETSSAQRPASAFAQSVVSCNPTLSTPVLKFKGFKEIVRSSSADVVSCEPIFNVPEDSLSDVKEMMKRTEWVRSPMDAIPLPTGLARYGTTAELFTRLQAAVATQACLSEETSGLLSFWILATWCSDALALSPLLVIVGPEFEGDRVLRTLRSFCRYPIMLPKADISWLRKLNWPTNPTLLFNDPWVTKQVLNILGCTTARGYMLDTAKSGYVDPYGSKAIFVGEDFPIDRMPRNSLQVRLQPCAPATTTQGSLSSTQAEVLDLQNQLLRYRTENLLRVYHSDFHAFTLTSDIRMLANALGACIVDCPELQSKLVSLLAPIESQRQADRATSIEALTLEAALNLIHQSKTQVLVNEISTEVNVIAKARGERQQYSAEIIGHRLKKVGVVTRRLGKAGKGLGLDLATVTQIHELAAVYGVGPSQEEENLHCTLCAEHKSLM